MIDLRQLGESIARQGRVIRIVIAGQKGSTPRETGTSMLVWEGGSSGTIGGGRLELDAMQRAARMLADGTELDLCRQPLGPALGQCCGGAVTLVHELWDSARLRTAMDRAHQPHAGVVLRRVEGASPMPERLRRRLQRAAAQVLQVDTDLVDGWLVEQTQRPRLPVFIYGAGHVGLAMARVLAPLPQLDVFVVDARPDCLNNLPDNLRRAETRTPQTVMAQATAEAAHFILTPDHQLDLELCHCLLQQRFALAGLIGSATKWARFKKRLIALGHSAAAIDRIECPIGDPALGKHPQAIAVGVAARILALPNAATQRKDVA